MVLCLRGNVQSKSRIGGIQVLSQVASLNLLWLNYCRSLLQFQEQNCYQHHHRSNNSPFQTGRFRYSMLRYQQASHLACLRAVRIKLDLLSSQLSPSIHIVTQVNPSKCPLAQELPPAPCYWSAGCCEKTTTHLLTYEKRSNMKTSNGLTELRKHCFHFYPLTHFPYKLLPDVVVRLKISLF